MTECAQPLSQQHQCSQIQTHKCENTAGVCSLQPCDCWAALGTLWCWTGSLFQDSFPSMWRDLSCVTVAHTAENILHQHRNLGRHLYNTPAALLSCHLSNAHLILLLGLGVHLLPTLTAYHSVVSTETPAFISQTVHQGGTQGQHQPATPPYLEPTCHCSTPAQPL